MNTSIDHADDGSFALGALATAVLDSHGTVIRWSQAAAELVGRAAAEVCGHQIRELLADAPEGPCPAAPPTDTSVPAGRRVLVRHRSGGTVDVTFRMIRLEGVPELLVLAAPTHSVTEQELGVSLLRALMSQDRIGVRIHDTDLNVVRAHAGPEMFGGLPLPPGHRLTELIRADESGETEAALRQVLKTGAPLISRDQRIRSPQVPGREWDVSMSAFRLEDARERPRGIAAVFLDTTEERRSRRYLDLLHEAAARVGRSLDVERAAQELAEVVAPVLGDHGLVDLAEAVLSGDEPPKWQGGGDLHLRAVASATGWWPAAIRKGQSLPPLHDHPLLRSVQRGETITMTRQEANAAFEDPRLIELLLPRSWHSVMITPVYARGFMLGTMSVWRVELSEPFTTEEETLLKEIASRGALAIDNARRYTREHRAAIALQQRMLPPATTDTPAAETAGLYRPAGGGAEIGGDWFDAIPLPSLRLALVVGDVVGHGLAATATMGRLRTAVHTLADLDLEPDELLTRLGELVQRLAAEAPGGSQDAVGATCLYAVYDPVTCACVLASAGHPPPVVVQPDGTTQVVPISPGPPLGVGGLPFETTAIDLEPGSLLALYTKGLLDRGDHDLDSGLQRLTDTFALRCRPDDPLRDMGGTILNGLDDQPARDDIALLLARTRAVPTQSTASWEFPAEPTVVADAREATTRQLAAWGIDELAFTTELVVSELVTNAIRYAGGPVRLRLIRANVLVCEVIDTSNTQPRMRRALTTDEGGRGLFLVAQLTTRWGCRYGQHGKTIWAEQFLTAQADPPGLGAAATPP
ncbi:SpoIIE family protein phosphatase [Streptomyces sp. SID5914]|nr:SpoIIE family protein phosphatase [Streptomyces sp. SID5914]MZG18660.1 SpoIIE family protein phosphatase [Streptomyces sp. SID5914]